MKRQGPATELRALRRFIAEAEERFLKPHVATTTLGTPSRAEELDVAAFVVLAHGAIENYVEGVGLWVLQTIEKKWKGGPRTSRCLAALLLHSAVPADADTPVSVFDTIRIALNDAKGDNSKRIKENNGIAMRHLRSIFGPIGIDVPDDPKLAGSLELLVSLRHRRISTDSAQRL